MKIEYQYNIIIIDCIITSLFHVVLYASVASSSSPAAGRQTVLTEAESGTPGEVLSGALSPWTGEQESDQTSKDEQGSDHQNGNERIHGDQTPKTEIAQNGTETAQHSLDSKGSRPERS